MDPSCQFYSFLKGDRTDRTFLSTVQANNFIEFYSLLRKVVTVTPVVLNFSKYDKERMELSIILYLPYLENFDLRLGGDRNPSQTAALNLSKEWNLHGF